MKKHGVTKLVRDVVLEETSATVSYTEFESWWSAIYDRREKLKSFVNLEGSEHDADVSLAQYICLPLPPGSSD